MDFESFDRNAAIALVSGTAVANLQFSCYVLAEVYDYESLSLRESRMFEQPERVFATAEQSCPVVLHADPPWPLPRPTLLVGG